MVDAYWNPKKECMHSKSNNMLMEAISNNDNLYWETDIVKQAPPKHKQFRQITNP